MNIYTLLKGKELPLSEIPHDLHDQLDEGISSGFIRSVNRNDLTYFYLTIPLDSDPGPVDPRDYHYSLIYGASPPVTSYSIKGSERAEWVSQGARNTCTAWATVECKRILDLQKFDYVTNPPNSIKTKVTPEGSIVNDLPPNYFSAENIFQRSNGKDAGAIPQDALNAARKGMLLEQDQPTTISGSYIYPLPVKTIQTYKSADHSIDGYASLGSIKQVVDALNSNKPVYLCYALTTSYNSVILGTTDILPFGDPIGYHASACVGYETRDNEIHLKIQQTYEGRYKYNYMSPRYFSTYVRHAWAIIDQNEVQLIKSLGGSNLPPTTPINTSISPVRKCTIKGTVRRLFGIFK